MFVPYISKVKVTSNIYIERVLPIAGQIVVREGQKVVPYDHLGICTYSQKTIKMPKNFKPAAFKKEGQFYYYGSSLGKVSGKKQTAPFNGNLHKLTKTQFEFREEKKPYILLSGIWGTVEKVKEGSSVLVKSNAHDLNLVVSTSTSLAGELIVFPNPSHILEKFYLDEFTSGSSEGKIVYIGNHVSMSLLKDAIRYGVSCILAGSADRDVVLHARKSAIGFGLFSGFGEMQTPDEVFAVLNEVSNRYVFFQGDRNVLRIPTPVAEESVKEIIQDEQKAPLVTVKQGIQVLVLQNPYFGKSGIVNEVKEKSIMVKFNQNEEPVEVSLPNFFAIE